MWFEPIFFRSVNAKAKVVFGITQNEKDKIKITLLAKGCKWEGWQKPKPEISQSLIGEKPKNSAENLKQNEA